MDPANQSLDWDDVFKLAEWIIALGAFLMAIGIPFGGAVTAAGAAVMAGAELAKRLT